MSERTYSADELINEIHETLAQWDGEDLAEVARNVLGHDVSYDGDSIYTVIEDPIESRPEDVVT